ncbi:exported hypothetical protein [Candidatus Sulfopaludibacter sp. SbA4]|nr:exported hypothetical protein [Candidatus Sulfopaludibacter sp. SbA4]
MTSRYLLSVLCVGRSMLLLGQSAGGSIDGTVKLTDGAPIPGCWITAMRPSPRQGVAGTAVSDKNGNFSIAGLQAGTYALCAQASGQIVDPCAWSANPERITLVNGQVSAGNVLTVSSGSLLRVRLADPSGYLKAVPTGTASGHVFLGVWTPTKLFFPLRRDLQDAHGRELGATHSIRYDTDPVGRCRWSCPERFQQSTPASDWT